MPSRPMLKTPARSQIAPPSAASSSGVTKRGTEARKDGSSRKSSIAVASLVLGWRHQRDRDAACDKQDDHRLHDQRDLLRHLRSAFHAGGAGLKCREEEAGERDEPGDHPDEQ